MPASEALLAAARAARENAVADFSHFKVGAALETDAGEIITGCNVENASYGLTVCAERVAIWKAISQGKRKIKHIAVVADTEELTPPCGVCRQIIWEYCKNAKITLANLRGQKQEVNIGDLLPRAFDARFLRENKSGSGEPASG